jgi:GMP reductase
MKSVINKDNAVFLAKNNYFYIMHRFNIDNLKFVELMHKKQLFASISIGIKKHDFEVIENLAKNNIKPEYITIDIAHGHSSSVKKMIKFIKSKLPNAFIIAGNIATPSAVIDLERWGADATKIGIGPGKVCITKLKTGFGTGGWQLSAIKWCSRVANKPIIADGGIREHGDIAKSIRFGASMVMAGSLFANLENSPGKIVEVEGVRYKEYYGSASDFNKVENKHIEGKKILQPIKGTLELKLKEIKEDLQSSISYSGGSILSDIKKVDYVIIGGDNSRVSNG